MEDHGGRCDGELQSSEQAEEGLAEPPPALLQCSPEDWNPHCSVVAAFKSREKCPIQTKTIVDIIGQHFRKTPRTPAFIAGAGVTVDSIVELLV